MCIFLFFDAFLHFQTVMEIYNYEDPIGIILSVGGQIPNNIAMDLHRKKVWSALDLSDSIRLYG